MATSTPTDWNRWLTDPLALGAAASGYLTDAWQRGLLYADIRRQRGNQYRQHLRETAPNVLDFPSEPVMSGIDLPQPVNYALLRIPTGVWYGFAAMGDAPALICNCADISHDPAEGQRLPVDDPSIPYAWNAEKA